MEAANPQNATHHLGEVESGQQRNDCAGDTDANCNVEAGRDINGCSIY